MLPLVSRNSRFAATICPAAPEKASPMRGDVRHRQEADEGRLDEPLSATTIEDGEPNSAGSSAEPSNRSRRGGSIIDSWRQRVANSLGRAQPPAGHSAVDDQMPMSESRRVTFENDAAQAATLAAPETLSPDALFLDGGGLDENDDDTELGGNYDADDAVFLPVSGVLVSNATHRQKQLSSYLSAYKQPHKFTDAEVAKMKAFESVEYWPSVDEAYRNYLKERRGEPRFLKWAIYCSVGVVVGTWAVLVFHAIEALGKIKTEFVDFAIERGGIWAGYAGFLTWSCVMAAISTLCCVVLPAAAGSGVPDVMSFLNGVMTSGAFRVQILLMKSLSCICGVNSGLPVGAEGPMIHIGAIIGGGISSGRSRSLKCGRQFTRIFRTFQNRRDQRDFIAAGSAAGVASVFSSPLGGLLFVLEEVASFFPQKLAWMVFTCCLCCYVTQLALNSYVDGFMPRERDNYWVLDPVVAVLFNVNVTSQQYLSLYLLSFIPTVVVAFVMALVATLFIKVHLWYAARVRARFVGQHIIRKVLEPVVYVAFFATVWYWLPFAFACKPIPADFRGPNADALLKSLDFMTATCHEGAGFYNPLATLTMTNADNAIKLLMVRKHADLFPPVALFVYWVIYTFGAACTAGTNIASGVVIPTFIIGCTGGRFLTSLLPESWEWADAGLMAMIGAASFFSGLSRLTFSLVVIISEVCNDQTHILLVMAGIAVAKLVADRLSHSLYHEQISRRGIPFLDSDTRIHKLDTFSARNIMTRPAVTLSRLVSVADLWDLIKLYPHASFPLVADARGIFGGGATPSTPDMTYCGLVRRDTLCLILWHLFICETDNITDEPTLPTMSDLQELQDMLFWDRSPPLPVETCAYKQRVMDLLPFSDRGATCVSEDMCISRTYGLFRSLGLRRIVVIDGKHQVTGILTRRNLVGHFLMERCRSAVAGMRPLSPLAAPLLPPTASPPS